MAAVAPDAAAGGPPIKRIYVGNDDHTDYMWSGTTSQYRTAFINMLNYYMSQAEATAGNPPHARSKFNCDGSVWVWEYERNRPAADFQRLIDHLRAGTITMPLSTAVMVHGAMPAEALLRNLYYAGRLERRYGLRFKMVTAMENQTMPGGIASLWAGAGARYSWHGICHCATRIDAANRPREIYHFTGPDGASVCMKWNSRRNGQHSIGGYCELLGLGTAVDYLDSNPDFQSRWPWAISAAFGYGCDELQTTTSAVVDLALSHTNANRQVIVSNQVDFFEDFLSYYGSEIPTFSGSFGNEWDLYTASMGEVTADFKRHVEKLRTAEALATVVSLFDTNFMLPREVERDSAFLACGLFYEHDWTADGSVSRTARAQWQRSIKDALTRYVDRLHDDALAGVGARIAHPGSGERHFVFNPLSWERTDYADLEAATPAPRHVVDVATGLEVPCENVTVGGAPRLRILASGVPSVGYRVYEVRPGPGASYPPAATHAGSTIDNGRYAVRLGTNGSIVSWIDRADGNRELVDASSGGGLHHLNTGSGTVTLASSGPVSTTLSVNAGGSPAHQSRVTLYAGIDRVDVERTITQNFNTVVAYRSAFALPGAVMRHEEVGMIARVARAAQGGDYADQNTRTDYLTFNHFVDLSLPDRGVTMSNWDSPFFGAGNSTITTLDASPVIRAVVGMQVDGTGLGIPDQGGDTFFLNRYALRAHGPYDQAAAMRFALEHQNPFVAGRVTGPAIAPLPDRIWSLVSIDNPEVLLWALKPAEEGIHHGIMARVWNLAETPQSFALGLPPLGVHQAFRTTHVETDLGPATIAAGQLAAQLQRQQMATFRLNGTLQLPVPPVGPDRGEAALALHPNPVGAGAVASIGFALPAAGRVRVTVHDVRGARVATLRDAVSPAGRNAVVWDGAVEGGGRAGPGVYWVRVATPAGVRSGKLVRIE